MKPHKHAELIKAWADGETIEVLSDNEWYIILGPINWEEDSQYRIKHYPAPVYRELVVGEIIQDGDELLYDGIWVPYVGYVGHRYIGCCSEHTRTTRPAPAPKPEVKPDYAIPVNLKLTFDGETNQLKSAEVIK